MNKNSLIQAIFKMKPDTARNLSFSLTVLGWIWWVFSHQPTLFLFSDIIFLFFHFSIASSFSSYFWTFHAIIPSSLVFTFRFCADCFCRPFGIRRLRIWSRLAHFAPFCFWWFFWARPLNQFFKRFLPRLLISSVFCFVGAGVFDSSSLFSFN